MLTRPSVLSLLVFAALCPGQAQESIQKAEDALRRGDTVRAIAQFTIALGERKTLVPARAALGRIAIAQRRYGEAVEHFTAVLEYREDDGEALHFRGAAYAALHNTQASLMDLRRAAGLSPRDPSVLLLFGRALLSADSVDHAITVLSTAKIYAPKNGEILEALGDAFWRLPIPSAAINHYKEALNYTPRKLSVQMKLAQLYLDRRRYTEAVRAFAAAHAIDSTYADAYLEEGRIYVRARLHSRAIEPLRTFVRLRPGIAEADSLLIEALYGSGNYAATVRRARVFLNRDSSSAAMWRIYAYALLEMGKHAEAAAAISSLGRRTPLSGEDLFRLGMAYAAMDREEESIAAYSEAVRLDSSISDAFNRLGILYMKRHEYGKAAEMFEGYLAGAGERSVSARLNAGACYLAVAPGSPQRDSLLNRARILLLSARDVNPENLTIRFRLAQYYVLADSFDLAQIQYREVIDLAGKSPGKHKREIGEAWAQIAFGHAFRKEYREALQAFPNAVAAGYENSNLYLQWGLAELQTIGAGASAAEARKTAQEATRLFRQASKHDPSNAQAHFWLGESLIRQRIEGENDLNKKLTEEACREFRRAVALDPSNDDAKKEMFRYGCK